MRKYYIAYVGRHVWGIGNTESTAKKDAEKWIKQYAKFPNDDDKHFVLSQELKSIKTIECTKELYYTVRDLGGNISFWQSRKNIAHLLI